MEVDRKFSHESHHRARRQEARFRSPRVPSEKSSGEQKCPENPGNSLKHQGLQPARGTVQKGDGIAWVSPTTISRPIRRPTQAKTNNKAVEKSSLMLSG